MFEYLVYLGVKCIVMNLPRRFSYKLAVVIADIFYIFAAGKRRAILENLKIAFPKKENTAIAFYARLTFRNFGKCLVDFFRFGKFDRYALEKEVTISGLQNVEECLKAGRGLITVTAHLGNWELGGIVMALLGYKFNVVALSHGSVRVDSLFISQRQNKGVRVIPLGHAAPRCIRALRKNELVALLGDRNINETGVRISFFGKEASLPRGPATLSVHTGAPIMPGFLIRTREDRFRLILEKPLADVETPDKEEKIIRMTRETARVIETYIRRYPGQWFMFCPLWSAS